MFRRAYVETLRESFAPKIVRIGGWKRIVDTSSETTRESRPVLFREKRSAGYVRQQDELLSGLTVGQTLKYASMLRCPSVFSPLQRARRVSEVLRDLGLDAGAGVCVEECCMMTQDTARVG